MTRAAPGRNELIRLVGAVLPEQGDEWTEGRCYIGQELLVKSRIRVIAPNPAPAVGALAVTHPNP